jgi:hypothetical protein
LSAAAAAARRPAREEAWLVAALCCAALAYWLAQYRPFQLPNNDFATFGAVARSFSRLELPGTFQRLPLLPGLMALAAPLAPPPHRLLHAALALNLAFAAATLPLLFAFAGRALGRGAALLPVLFAGTTQLHSNALQPLVEPSLGFFVALSFVLFQRRSPWQYAAAGAAALSRYEAVLLFPLFAALCAREDRRSVRHAVLAASGAAPFALWVGLGAVRGSGAAFYAADMERMGWTPAPHALATAAKEALRGWWSGAPGPDLPAFALAGLLPIAAGLALGARRFGRETIALAVYFAGTIAVVVALGIDKARYAYPVLWIPLLFWSAGALLGARWLRDRLGAAQPAAAALALAGALAALAVLARRWLGEVARAPHDVVPAAVDLAYLAALALLAVLAIAAALRDSPSAGAEPRGAGRAPASAGRGLAGAAAGALAFALALPLLAGGMEGKATEQRKIYWANHGAVVAARFLAEHLREGERAVVMQRQHFLFLTGFDSSRFVGFFELEAEDVAALRAEMRARGITHLVATWRKPPAQAIDHVYERKYKWFLADPFARGEAVAGFELVVALPLPPHLEQPPVFIYRTVP